MIDVGEPIGPRHVVRLRDGVAELGYLVGLKAVGDAHFIEISVARKRQEAGVLVFPAEPPHAHLSGSFDDWHTKDLAAAFAMRRLALWLGKVQESLIGNGFDEAVTQKI